MAAIQASEALKARARAIRDELTDTLVIALSECVDCKPDHFASLTATLVVATWTVALIEAHRAFQHHKNLERANKVLLELVDRGTKGVQAALNGTPFG